MALDTRTGQLCKTYSWEDTQDAPGGLPLCSQLATVSGGNVVGAQKAYLGYTYTFDGTKWIRGLEAKSYSEADGGSLVPLSDDQYDPLDLFTRDEKAKMRLTKAEIRQVADQFGVSFENALEDAKVQGYQVP
ncbi:MAG: hypothetical protein HY316_09720 [Acidobacteria bacterium]|nr:hypothetical protein [Acidobacteriota bacterium]